MVSGPEMAAPEPEPWPPALLLQPRGERSARARRQTVSGRSAMRMEMLLEVPANEIAELGTAPMRHGGGSVGSTRVSVREWGRVGGISCQGYERNPTTGMVRSAPIMGQPAHGLQVSRVQM
jgi:hypothetical protein